MANKVNQETKKKYSLKKKAKAKHIGTGDGGLITDKGLKNKK